MAEQPKELPDPATSVQKFAHDAGETPRGIAGAGTRLVDELADETARTLSKPIQAVNVQKAKRA